MIWEKHSTKMFLWVLTGSSFLALIEILFEVHFPGTDVFLFKEAGVNLATKGKFVASYLPHMPFGVETTFSYYPPVYPFLFGVWSWIVGVGLPQSLLFDSLLTISRTLLVLALIIPTLPDQFFQSKNRFQQLLFTLFLVLLSVVSTDRDRPDELGIVFGLILVLFLQSKKRSFLKVVMGSLFLALVGGTSPACGVFFGLYVLAWAFSQHKGIAKAGAIALGSGVTWLCMIAPVLLTDLGSSSRFSKQVGLSSFPYLKNVHDFRDWGILFKNLDWNIRLFYSTGSSYVWMMLVSSILGLWCLKNNKKDRVLLATALIFGGLVPLVWTLQPYYLWFSTIVLLIGIFRTALAQNPMTQKGMLAVLYIALGPLLFWEAKCVYNTLWIPASEKRETIANAVLRQIEPHSKLAVTHDQYFTFRGKKEVINVAYWPNKLSELDYLYITDLPDSTRRTRKSRELLSQDQGHCFEVLQDLSKYQELPSPQEQKYYVRGNGGVLLKNKCKSNQS